MRDLPRHSTRHRKSGHGEGNLEGLKTPPRSPLSKRQETGRKGYCQRPESSFVTDAEEAKAEVGRRPETQRALANLAYTHVHPLQIQMSLPGTYRILLRAYIKKKNKKKKTKKTLQPTGAGMSTETNGQVARRTASC